MNRTLVVCSSNRPVDYRARDSIMRLVHSGAALIDQHGSSDVAFARNVALSRALHVLTSSSQPLDTVLMVDDDMVFSEQAASEVVVASRLSGTPTSGCYALADGRVPFEELTGSGRYMTGLGFLAIPVKNLTRLVSRSLVFTADDGAKIIEFTKSASAPRKDGSFRWLPEDYYLTQRLGGVDLAPVVVGHLKTMPVLPTADAIRALTAARAKLCHVCGTDGPAVCPHDR